MVEYFSVSSICTLSFLLTLRRMRFGIYLGKRLSFPEMWLPKSDSATLIVRREEKKDVGCAWETQARGLVNK